MSKDEDKTKDQLIDDLVRLRQIIAELEKSENQLNLAEKALRESEKRFRELTDLLPEIVFETDIEGNLTFANQIGFDTFGYTQDDFDRGLNAFQMLVSEDQDKARENFARLLKGEKLGLSEYMAQTKYGEIFPVIIHSAPINDNEGNTVGLRGIIVNITELKRAEDAYQELVDHSVQGIIILQNGRIVFANQAATEISGYTLERLYKLSSDEFQAMIHPDDREFVLSLYRDRLKGERLRDRYEFRGLKPDGLVFWIEVYSSLIEYQGKPAVQATFIDITERKIAEKALRESEEKFRTLAEQSPNMIFINKKGKVVYANKKCEEIMKYTKDEFYSPDFDFLKLIAPEYLEQVKINFSKHLIEEEVEPLDYDLITKDGKRISAILTSKLINYEGEKAILGTVTDITERKKAEEELLFKSALLEAQSETSIDGILVVDNEGKSILFNKRFGEMWNIPQEILDTKDDEKMLQYVLNQLKYPEKFLTKVQYLYAHQDEKSRDEIEFKDGKVFDRYSSPLMDSNGKYHGRIWYFRDITKQKKAEETLKQRAEELEKSKAELQQSLKELLKRVELERDILITQPIPKIGIDERGSLFLFPVDRENEAYALFRSRKDANRPALAITRTFPPRFQRKISREIEMVWLTSNRVQELVCVDPSDTMTLLLVISEFFKRAPEGVVLFEGIEYIISMTGFERFLHIIQILNDKIATLDGTIYMVLDLGVLEEKEARYILRESLLPPEDVKKELKDSRNNTQ